MNPIKVALVGYGMSAKTFHLPFIQALNGFTLHAISTSQTQAIAAAFPHVTAYNSAQEMIAETDAELVIITAPNQAHYPLAQHAIAHGKHVLLEKPFVVTSAQGQSLIEQAQAANVQLTVFHSRRWDGDFLTVKQLLTSQQLGPLKLFESHYDRFRPNVRQRWRESNEPGAGILYDLGSHLIDQALALFGLPTSLTAQILAQREGGKSSDYFHIQLHYPYHEVILHSSPFCASPTLRFHLQGHHGSYIKHGLDPQEEQLKSGVVDITSNGQAGDEKGTLYRNEAKQTIVNQRGAYHQFYRQLAAAITSGSPLPVSAVDALKVIQLIELCEQSQSLGQTLEINL